VTQAQTNGVFHTQADTGERSASSGLDELLSKDLLGPSHVIEALTRAEIDVQIATAKKYPRSIRQFTQAATEMATLTEDVAASCMYALPRDGKTVDGPSVRLAEIVASAWGNIRVDARIVEVGETALVARAMCLDLERNQGQSVEVRRRITTKGNRRYSEDMIGVTAMAAISIARRNAIFAVVPRAYVDPIMEEARRVSIGTEKTLAARRKALIDYFTKAGIPPARLFATINVAGEQDITLDHLATLRGIATGIKDGTVGIDEAFPDTLRNGPTAAAMNAAVASTANTSPADPAAPVPSQAGSTTAAQTPAATPGLTPQDRLDAAASAHGSPGTGATGSAGAKRGKSTGDADAVPPWQ